jgi:hypothetical protein
MHGSPPIEQHIVVCFGNSVKDEKRDCGSKVIMSGVNSNVIMSGYGDEPALWIWNNSSRFFEPGPWNKLGLLWQKCASIESTLSDSPYSDVLSLFTGAQEELLNIRKPESLGPLLQLEQSIPSQQKPKLVMASFNQHKMDR